MHFSTRIKTVIAAAVATGAVLSGAAAADAAQPLASVAITPSSNSALVLDVSGASTSPGAGVIQWHGTGGSNQRWNFIPLSDGNEQIVNQNSGMCLTTSSAAGAQLYQMYCNGSLRQEWSGTPTNAFGSSFAKIGYPIYNPYTGLYMDINGGSKSQGAAVVGWYYNGGDNQMFQYFQL